MRRRALFTQASRTDKKGSGIVVYIFTAALIILLDAASKEAVKRRVRLGEKLRAGNRLYIFHVKNTGAAFGIFKGRLNALVAAAAAMCGALACGLTFLTVKRKRPAMRLFLAFTLGGALGNLIDRVRNRSVTDFIYYEYKKLPVFNIADLFIFAGSLGAFLASLFCGKGQDGASFPVKK